MRVYLLCCRTDMRKPKPKPKQAPKAAKTKPKVPSMYLNLVVNTIREIGERGGSSVYAIKARIVAMRRGVGLDATFLRALRTALASGVADGVLRQKGQTFSVNPKWTKAVDRECKAWHKAKDKKAKAKADAAAKKTKAKPKSKAKVAKKTKVVAIAKAKTKVKAKA